MFKKAAPAFGKPMMEEGYYRFVRTYVESLRGTTTHRQIASNLNQMGYKSPAGRPFCKATVANFLRRTSLK